MTATYHFIGIGGIGMSSLARILLDKKMRVQGSDLRSSAITRDLAARGAVCFEGHQAERITSELLVVYGTDIKEDNPELQAARERQCKILHRAELLALLAQDSRLLAVTGTHGKTTTSALLTWTLFTAGLDPSFSVGGIIPHFQSNGQAGEGGDFVAEADESDASFLQFFPHAAIITNIGLDHMSYFKSEQALLAAFQQFAAQVKHPDLLFFCGDDSRLSAIKPAGISYGFGSKCALRCSSYRQVAFQSFCDISFDGNVFSEVELGLIGKHHALNATAVCGVAYALGIKEEPIRKALKTFAGVGRRLEKIGSVNSCLFFDDYGHHPTEIQTTLDALKKAIFPKKLIAVFQPHRYTRTRDCLGLFQDAFRAADKLIVTDIYSAQEEPIAGIDAYCILSEVEASSSLPCCYVPKGELVEYVAASLNKEEVLVTLGAGDITTIGRQAFEKMKEHG